MTEVIKPKRGRRSKKEIEENKTPTSTLATFSDAPVFSTPTFSPINNSNSTITNIEIKIIFIDKQ